MNYLINKPDNRRSRVCNLNAGPLGTFFQKSLLYLLPVGPFERHTLPSTGWDCGLRSLTLEWGCLRCARYWQKHPPKRFSILLCTTCEASWAGDRGQIIRLSPIAQEQILP